MRAILHQPAIHLEAAQLTDALERCPVCGSDLPRQRLAAIQHDPAIFLLSCSKCGGCSASHMPRPEVLDEYYGGYFHDDGPKITLWRINGFVNRLLRVMTVGKRPTHLRVLDFGGGDGTLGLAVARRLLTDRPERSVDFTLVDYQVPAEAVKGERLKVSHWRNLEQTSGPFDLIVASAVLEHIPNLKPVLERLFGLLAEGGWFYARTPYVAPLKRLMPKLDITYPGHVHDLGAPFWSRVPKTYGLPLRVVASRPSLVETHLFRQPVRTLAAWLMKLPARMEVKAFSSPRTPFWRLVGGWEVILQMQNPKREMQDTPFRTNQEIGSAPV